jgi:hypothetical protein
VKLATERIEELSGKAKAIAARTEKLEAVRPDQPRREEIEAILADVPDLSDLLARAEGEDLVEPLDAFDIQVRYDKPERTLELSALLSADLFDPKEATARTGGRRIRS